MIPLSIWMNMPSPYQADLFRALVSTGEVDLDVIFARRMTADRQALGWTEDLRGYHHRFLNERTQLLDAARLARSRRLELHILNGIWAESAFAVAFGVLRSSRARYAIYTEASAPGPRGRVRRTARAALARAAVPGARGFLPVSHHASDELVAMGARGSAIYPFGYFRNHPLVEHGAHRREADPRIIFVGQLIYRKGVDLLLDAFARLAREHAACSLSFIGTGEMASELCAQVLHMGLDGRVSIEGSIPSHAIMERIAASHLLVLPSRFDGWGLVVNEALASGTPVVVSDGCGAADLIVDGVNGYVFGNHDVDDLLRCLRSFLASQAQWPVMREAAASMGAAVAMDAVAPYLVRCLAHMLDSSLPRPIAPWVEARASLARTARTGLEIPNRVQGGRA